MESVLVKIVNYLFQKKGLSQNYKTIDSILEDGISFPQLIAISFQKNISDLKINTNPKLPIQKQCNNNLALKYAKDNNNKIGDTNLDKYQDSFFINLFKFQTFKNYADFFNISNKILRPLNIQATTRNDLLSEQYLFNLVNILSDQKFDIDAQNVSYEMLDESFKKANVPSLIDPKISLDRQDKETAFIFQIQIILDVFSEKVDSIIKNQNDGNKEQCNNNQSNSNLNNESQSNNNLNNKSQSNSNLNNNQGKNSQNINNQSNESQRNNTLNDSQNNNNLGNNNKGNNNQSSRNQKSINTGNNDLNKKSNTELDKLFFASHQEEYDDLVYSISKNYDSIDIKASNQVIDDEENEIILKMVNILTEKMFGDTYEKFTFFSQTLKNDFIPIFVMKFFKETIDDIIFSQTKENKFTIQNKKNFYSTLNFIKKKEKTFHFLIFSFKSSEERNYSAKIFFQNFLNSFFIMQSKEEMIKRFENLIAIYKDKNHSLYPSASRYAILIGLMKLIDVKSYNEKDCKQFFNRYNVPFILNASQFELIKNSNSIEDLPDSYFYQLQFLFDDWDSYPSNKVIEALLTFKVKVPRYIVPFDHIASRIIAIRSYKNLIRLKRNKPKSYELLDQNEKDQSQSKTMELAKRIDFKNKRSRMFEIKDSYTFWNDKKIKYEYVYKDGLMINENSQKDMNYIEYFTKVPSSEENYIPLAKKGSYQTELYKIFYYDEQKLEWKFDQGALDRFSTNNKISYKDSEVPLIFYANTKEEDLIFVNQYFINGNYPNLLQDQIFVYAFCEKGLNNLHFSFYQNFEKTTNSSKPIFLAIHIPENKNTMPNISLIITQMYLFLSCICNLVIVILDHERYNGQIDYFKSIISLRSECEKSNKYTPSYEKNIIFKRLRAIFVFNLPNVQINPEFDIDNKPEFEIFKKNIQIPIKSCLISTNNFLSLARKIVSELNQNISLYYEVKRNFSLISSTKLSLRYLQIRKNVELNDTIVKHINERYEQINKTIKSSVNSMHQVYNEIKEFTPQIDRYFIDQAQKNLNSMLIELNEYKEITKSKLEKRSESNIYSIQKNLKNVKYVTKSQKDNLIRNHEAFLRKEFFNIISMISNDNLIEMYDANIDILKVLIEKDTKKLEELFKKYDKTIENRIIHKSNDYVESTNYVLKENANVKEIAVTIQINEDLKSIIEQDF
ncbi:hypothetical protein M9Y10_015525 [Tritrichomonas musculus]|uniref:LisH domain-containing protein n=1 Tax=Tritrichomonas musculus TaxID=1915356 RepID=A0ABR2L314_9EUKA